MISPEQREQLKLQLKWDPAPVHLAAQACNGCGLCRSRGDGLRMCPVFRHVPDEIASPRAKANLMQGVLNNQLELDVLTDSAMKTVADFCLNCQICRVECPVQVNIPYLAFRGKAAYAAAHGLPFAELFFTKIDSVLKRLSIFSSGLNVLLGNRLFRWCAEKTVGIPQGRKLPKLAQIPYLTKIAWSRRLTRPQRRGDTKVAILVDIYGNYCDTRLPEIAVKVLEHQGFHVLVPMRQQSSGLTAIASGHSDRAEWIAAQNVTVFADLVRQGYKIVALEPAAAVCLQREYPLICSDPDTALIADNTTDLCTFLYQSHLEGRLRLDFQPIHATLGYHAPCRSLVIGGGNLTSPTSAESLLRLIPGLEIRRLERGCCGMAGTFGLKKANYPLSLRLGVRLFSALRDATIQAGVTDCSTCKMQMEQGTTKKTFHPIKILAASYGLADDFLEELDLSLKNR
ncbi:MAG: heterodisulfide reductase-related iron-sulfur binding cluster [Planctomycetaceae bacterium]|nr:heterodisulfide reductase-related iron-sulfur binding cluster [Planctomycetaceae bacterium]